MSKKSPAIPAPKEGLFGVAIRADGAMENVGIGSFDIKQAEQLACQLESLAGSIRAKAKRVFPAK